jgi:hypothetical protein
MVIVVISADVISGNKKGKWPDRLMADAHENNMQNEP